MIEIKDNVLYLHSTDTTYAMMIDEQKHLEHIYYGSRIEPVTNIDDIRFQYQFELGGSTSYSKDAKNVTLNQKPLEISWFGKGDYREPTVHLELPNGSRTIDLLYKSHEIIENLTFSGMPQTEKTETLQVVLEDAVNNLEVILYYTVFEEQNCMVRNLQLTNHNKEDIILDKILSFSLDMKNKDYSLRKLDGSWIRERHVNDTELTIGTVRFDSKKGVSSSDHNPFFMIKEPKTVEDYGNAYGFALVYSGNFEANIEINSHDFIRLNMGINSFDFRYNIGHNETFVTPEVILSFSNNGITTLTNQFHDLINSAIINQNFRHKERPILINNWEATYMDFNQKKIVAIAKQAHKLGIELFCLDDGWFAKRNDDFSSLGDWYYNAKKLPRGVKGLADKINKIGLEFGIWVEPEMVNEDSDLYRAHPEWAITAPKMTPSLGRNQLILDLTNPDVKDYLKKTMYDLFSSANISYVKWDMNRNFSDVFSHYLDRKEQGKFNHLYVNGLYEILEYLTTSFPDILFESCSSGGNRFDLGMLYYMPQTWTSDNTDAFERLLIQEGTSMCYPLSSISNHVNGDRSHQVMRHIPIETRFNVACFGVLGYELDVTELPPFEKKAIKRQIEYYKQHRSLFQFGTFHRLRSVSDSNVTIWMVMSKDNDEALIGYFQKLAQPNPRFDTIEVKGLQKGLYTIKNRPQYINIRTFGSLVNHVSPIRLKVNHFLHNLVANRMMFESEEITKELTNNQIDGCDIILPHAFTGTGHEDNDMILPDFGSRIYHVKIQN